MERGLLICFTGLDGSGKSTHARSLMKYLRAKGYSCTFVWGGSRPIFSYVFFGVTRLLRYWTRTRKDVFTNPLQHAPTNCSSQLGMVFRSLLFLDYQTITLLKIRPHLLFGRAVIADRYFYDLLMDLKRSGVYVERFSIMLSRTLPRPLLTFLLDAPENLTQERRGFPYEELRSKRTIYMQLARAFGFVVVDSSKDFDSNQQKIREMAVAEICKEQKSGYQGT